MSKQPGSGDEQARRLVYFAAERTLTSWIRTALSLMALGFVIDQFELVAHQVLGGPSAARLDSQELWRWGGSTLIALGVLMAVVAGIYHLRFALHYHRDGSTEVGFSLKIGALFTLLLGVYGAALLAAVVWVL